MESLLLSNDHDTQIIQGLIKRLSSKSTVVDFDEVILLSTVRATTRIWKQDGVIIGFAYVDDYNNLWFDTVPDHPWLDKLENEIIAWGVECMKRRNRESRSQRTLDCSCDPDNTHRIAVLEKYGFIPEKVFSLRYSRSLAEPVVAYPLPAGFSIRCVKGKDEVEDLVTLQRTAFGTENMTVAQRLAMMEVPQYAREMDLVAVAPNGELAAFCICGFDDPDKTAGHTDPIGTRPRYQRMGLGQALVSAGLIALKDSGATVVTLGTSSDNIVMQKLAGKLGFDCVAEKRWFSKTVT